MFINDECIYYSARSLDELARTRWKAVRDWVGNHIIEEKEPQP